MTEQQAQQAARLFKDAEREIVKATKELDADQQLVKAAKDLDALNDKVSSAVAAVVAAQSDADRASAKASLIQLHQDQADLKARVAADCM